MSIKFIQFHPERRIDSKTSAQPQRTLNVIRPAIGAPLEVDVIIVAVLHRQFLKTGLLRERRLEMVELRLMTDSIGNGERRVERNCVASDVRDFMIFAGGSIAVGEPAATGASLGGILGGGEIINIRLRRIML